MKLEYAKEYQTELAAASLCMSINEIHWLQMHQPWLLLMSS